MSRTTNYHHGDLPAAVMAAVEDIIRDSGVAAVSLREVARRTGVTRSAPAHHFGDKAGLLTAFAAQGFRLLRDRFASTLPSADASQELDFMELGLAYVEFAIDHPAHFAVMFRPELLHQDDPHYQRAAADAFGVLLDAVRTLRDDLSPDDPEILATATGAWSMTHGFATLWLDGELPKLAATDSPKVAAAEAFSAVRTTLLRSGLRSSAGPSR